MKKPVMMLLAVVFVLSSGVTAQEFLRKQLDQNKNMVTEQYRSDKEKKEAILRKMREFIGEINGRLGRDTRTRIDVPLDINAVDEIKDTTHFHTPQRVPDPVYAYINDDAITFATPGIRSQVVGKLGFGEKVEVIVRSEGSDTVNGVTAPWVLVRKASGEEGWVFGAYIQDAVPGKKLKAETAAVVKESPAPVKAPAKKFYAYIMDDDVRFRTGGNTSSGVLGKFDFAEKIEVLAQSKEMDTIDGKRRPWFMVQRANGEQGWVFGGFLQKKKPVRPATAVTPDTPAINQESKGAFSVPLIGKRTSNFGYRVHPVTKARGSFHKGIDIYAPTGTEVKATAGGVVVKAEFNRNGYGNLIVIRHDKEISSYYGHLQKILVRAGQNVQKGAVIGAVDSTGLSTGPHLHFEIRKGDTAMDPDQFLK